MCLSINNKMSVKEIEEYMKVYLELLINHEACKDTSWYKLWQETGEIDARWHTNADLKKLKNKRYQLSKGNLDQSFLLWRVMNKKIDELKVKHMSPEEYMVQAELCNKGLAPYQSK